MTRASLVRSRGELSPAAMREREVPIGQRFTATAREHPDAVAVEEGNAGITYAELDATTDRVAVALVERLGPDEEAVALLVGDTIQMAVALLGIIKAGKIALPLDDNQPDRLLAAIVADAGARVLLTDATAPRSFADVTGLAIADLSATAAAAQVPERTGTDPALLLYTSGSTGEPKGVLRSHRFELHQALTHRELMGLGPGMRVATIMSPAFAGAHVSIFGALLNGATLLRYDAGRAGLDGVPAWLTANEAEFVIFLTGMVAPLAVDPAEAAAATLRHVLVGGERVSGAVARKLQRLAPAAQVWQVYASTEAAVVGAGPVADWPGVGDDETVPLGPSHAGTRVEIDESGAIVASGLYIADGYWRRPGDVRFTRDPATGLVTYRSGDLGSVTDDGALLCLGRADRQVKIRGQRVELDAVERALGSLPGVSQAVVVAEDHKEGRVRLVGFVVADTARGADPLELKRTLARTLSPAAVPARIVVLDALPMLPTGKPDLRRLSAMGEPVQHPGTPAESSVERALAEIWEDVLDLRPIGVDDVFFDLGGDSLDVLEMLRAVEERFGWRVPVGVFAEHPTIAALRDLLRDRPAPAVVGPVSPAALEATGPRLFFVPGLRGDPMRAFHLSRVLAPHVSVFGFDMPGSDGKTATPDVAEMASEFLAAIRARGDTEPYWLCGYSFGGLVVAEMASQLERAGANSAGVILIDVNPGRYTKLARSQARPAIRERLTWMIDRRRGRPVPTSRRVAYLWEHNRRAASRHRASPFSAPALIIRAADNPDPDALMGWEELATGRRFEVTLSATHEQLFSNTHGHATADVIKRFVTADGHWDE